MISDRTGLDASDVVQHQCSVCRHLHRDRVLSCAAFPNGIPADIVDNSFDHREPHADDGGVRFAPVPSEQYPINLRAAVELAAVLAR